MSFADWLTADPEAQFQKFMRQEMSGASPDVKAEMLAEHQVEMGTHREPNTPFLTRLGVTR